MSNFKFLLSDLGFGPFAEIAIAAKKRKSVDNSLSHDKLEWLENS